jgi:hypothetical protein
MAPLDRVRDLAVAKQAKVTKNYITMLERGKRVAASTPY